MGRGPAPQALVTHLRSRGVTLLTPAQSEATPATPLMVVEPSGSPSTRAPIIAGRRLAVLHPDPGSADALAQALRAKGAEVVALSLNPESLERAEALDPDAVLMELTDFYGSCWEIARAILLHPRLKFATLLLTSPERAGGYAQNTPDVPSICFAVQSVSAEYEKLHGQARERDELSLTLDSLGPARALRLLIETNRSFRARFLCGELTFEVDVTEGIIAGAQGTTQGAANDVYLGVHALALLLTQDRGQVEVRKVDHPAATNVMAPLDTALHLARQAGAVAKPRAEHTVAYAPARPSRPTPREGWTAVSKPEARGGAVAGQPAVLRSAARSPDTTLAFEPRAHVAKAVPIVTGSAAAAPSEQEADKQEGNKPAAPPGRAAASTSSTAQEGKPAAAGAKAPAKRAEASAKGRGGEMSSGPRNPLGKKPQTSLKPPAGKASLRPAATSLRPGAGSAQPARGDGPAGASAKRAPQGSAPKPAPQAPKKTLVGLPAPKVPQAQAVLAAGPSHEAPRAAEAGATADEARRSLANAPTEPPPQAPRPDAPQGVAPQVRPARAGASDKGSATGAAASPMQPPSGTSPAAPAQSATPVLPADTSARSLAMALDRTLEVSDSAVVEVAPSAAVEMAPEPFSLRAPPMPERKRRRFLLLAPPLAIAVIAAILIARGGSEASEAEAPSVSEKPAPSAIANGPEPKASAKPALTAEPEQKGGDENADAPQKPAEASADSPGQADEADEEPDSADEADAEDKAAAQRASELVSQANKLRKRKKYALAKKQYNEALAVYPNYPRALTGLAQIALAQRDRKQAIALARQVVRARPNQASAHLLLGDAYKSAGMLKDAQASWRAAARLGSATARNRLKGR